MKKVEDIVLAAALILFFAVMLVCGAIDSVRKDRDNSFREACFDAAKQDIIAEYGFEGVVWLSVEEIDNLDGRDDFYIFTCLVDEGEIVEYRFAVVIREVNGELEVATWQLKEAT